MTSAIYLNNIPRLGDASHAIRMICFDAECAPKLLFTLENIDNYKNLYLIENFCDFPNHHDGVNLFNFLKITKCNIKIFISEDPNFYSIKFSNYFLLNHLCKFNYFLTIFILTNSNINIFFFLYKLIFLDCNKFHEKLLSKFFKHLFSLHFFDYPTIRWLFRSAIYSKILRYQKNVIIPNKRTLGPNRILESLFNLKVFNAKISDFDVESPVDPYNYEQSLLKTSFKNLNLYIYDGPSSLMRDRVTRKCYYENLTGNSSLSIFTNSTPYPHAKNDCLKAAGINFPLEFDSINVFMVSKNLSTAEINALKKYFFLLNLPNLKFNFLSIQCP